MLGSIFNKPTLFDIQALERFSRIEDYDRATPFPHLIFDGLFSDQYLRKVLKEWPETSDPSLETHNDGRFVIGKKGSTQETQFGTYTQILLDTLSKPDFLIRLEKVTGIYGLIPDPYLFGGGTHQTGVGGKLQVHVDFNTHFKFKIARRLNLLIYLNEGWTDGNGGDLELWDSKGETCIKSVSPIFNRMVVFSTSRHSYHGHPSPVVGPPGLIRRSIALYYYAHSNQVHQTSTEEHSTLWKESF